MLGYEIVNNGGRQGRIAIEGEISWWENSARDFTRQVDAMLSDGVTDLEVYLNTPGGHIFDANEIGNQIARFPGVKKARLGALCASAGTFISCYCDEVEASRNTQFMIHDPIMRLVIEHAEQWDTEKQAYVNLRDTALDLYSRKTGLDTKVLDEMMRKTTWLTAKQAQEKGFVDSIADTKSSMPDDAKNVLQTYRNTMGVPVYLNYLFEETPATANDTISNLTDNTAMEDNSKSGIRAVVALAKAKGLNEKTIQKMAESSLDAALEFVEDYTAPQMAAPQTTNQAEAVTPAATPPANQERLADVLRQVMAENGADGRRDGQAGKETKPGFTEMSKNDSAGLKKLLQTDAKAFADLFAAEFGHRPTEAELSLVQ